TAGESSTGSSAAGGAGSTSDGAATDASTTGEPAGGAAGAAASGGAANGSGAAAGSDAGQQTAGTPVTAAASGGAGGSDGGGFGGEPSTTGEPPPPVPLGAVLITEYVEGVDGDDKAVELSNLSDETVVLSECRLETYFNGNLESSSGVDLTTIELRPQTSYVLCKSSASTGLSSACHRAAASINFNGDDALVLRCNGVIHDSFGQVGFDPGDEWRSSESSSGTADHVLRRRCGAAARTESSSPFEAVLGEDWISVWTFDEGTSAEYPGLGIAACAEPDAAVDAGGSDAGTGGAASE
ncbi:MAG TPA: lamin tail domain-containing protein, partial [Polyangiaceae bacterium]